MILTLIPKIPTVRMIGIQKEKCMTLSLFITHTSGLHPYKEELFQIFLLVPTLVDTNVGTLGGSTSKKTIFNPCPIVLKSFWVTVFTAYLVPSFSCWMS